ncbi:hypothetical protein B0H14DRAFT_3427300 [Mycena olivaceomarginata]|nr:hypothetical protein B0H14DRAFT_3427300 [Mycena olivaceomarginata]
MLFCPQMWVRLRAQTSVVAAPRTKRWGVHSGAMPFGELPPSADRQDHLPAPFDTSDPLPPRTDPISLAESIPIPNERHFIPVSVAEVDAGIKSSSPGKAPDRYAETLIKLVTLCISPFARSLSLYVLASTQFSLPRPTVALGAKPNSFKSNIATPVHKAGKKDKTSPNFEHILAKPLERLVANRLSFDAESLGFLEDAQYGGRPGHSTLQTVDGYIHRVKAQLDQGNNRFDTLLRPQGGI